MPPPAEPALAAATTAPGPKPGALLLAVPDLLSRVIGSPEVGYLRRVLADIPGQTTQTLIARIATTEDPVKLWALHLALDRREIPPCLRWPANESTDQADFITLTADLLWFTKRNPLHRPEYRGWRDLFTHRPESPAWHAAALRQYRYACRRSSLAHWCALGLGLSDAQRQALMTMPTNAMRADRRQLHSTELSATREALTLHAQANPDKSRKRTWNEVAERRALIWRTYILAGRSPTRASSFWHLLTGESLTRQAMSKQIDSIKDAICRARPGRAVR